MAGRSRVRINVVANMVGSAWQAALGLLFPPIFARWMGIEAYGLVGFFASLTSLLGLFELGLGMTLSREIARLSTQPDEGSRREAADLVKTFELIYWALGTFFALGVVALAPWLSRHAINRSTVAEAEATQSIRLMGLALGAQLAQSGYVGVLHGAQRQAAMSAILAGIATAKHTAAVLLFFALGRAAPLYFVGHASAAVAGAFVMAFVARRAAGGTVRGASFRPELLRRNVRYTAGIWLMYPLSILLTQADKFVVGKMLPLAEFGRYALALSAGNAIYFLNSPIFGAIVPRFTQLYEAGDRAGVTALFRKASQALVVLVTSAAATLIVFRQPVLAIWSHSETTAAYIGTAFALRAAATAVHCALHAPYGLSLATGTSRHTLLVNGVAALCFVPLEIALVARGGIDGAALGWLVVVVLSFVAWLAIVRRQKWLDDSFWGGLWRNVLAPAGACMLVVVVARRFAPEPAGKLPTLALAAAVGALALGAGLLAARDLGPTVAHAAGGLWARVRRTPTAG